MSRIDAHQHFWKFDPVRDSQIMDDMAIIQKDFFQEELLPVLKQNKIDGCVVVQPDQSEEENNFQLENAEKYHFIKGVVGCVDIEAHTIEEQIVNTFSLKK